jgi:ABC-type transport system substrate-binding protein
MDFVGGADTRPLWRNGRYDVSPFDRELLGGPDTVVRSDPSMSTIYLAFRADRPPLDDVRIRRALAHAIDREKYVARQLRFQGDPSVTGGFVPPTVPGHSHRVAPAYDSERARALLAEAGYPGGRGLPELSIAETEGGWGLEVLAEQFAEVGVRTCSAQVHIRDYFDHVRGDVDGFLWGWNADVPDPSGIIPPFLETHDPILRTSEIEALVARARSVGDQDKRLAMYREAERQWIGEHVAVLPLMYFRRTVLLRPWIEGFWQNALVTSTFAEVVVRPELRSAARRDEALPE